MNISDSEPDEPPTFEPAMTKPRDNLPTVRLRYANMLASITELLRLLRKLRKVRLPVANNRISHRQHVLSWYKTLTMAKLDTLFDDGTTYDSLDKQLTAHAHTLPGYYNRWLSHGDEIEDIRGTVINTILASERYFQALGYIEGLKSATPAFGCPLVSRDEYVPLLHPYEQRYIKAMGKYFRTQGRHHIAKIVESLLGFNFIYRQDMYALVCVVMDVLHCPQHNTDPQLAPAIQQV